jgi:hypothetical protein
MKQGLHPLTLLAIALARKVLSTTGKSILVDSFRDGTTLSMVKYLATVQAMAWASKARSWTRPATAIVTTEHLFDQ